MSLLEELHRRGPVSVATFMELALYHPAFGYYARANRRSGRAGDFFTSVDVGPLFGELLEAQIAEMFDILGDSDPAIGLDLVEAGASDGRLAADILRAARARQRSFYDSLRLHLVEASPTARAAQIATLADVSDRVASSSPDLPDSFEGVLFANELIDALPVHQVVMGENGLREIYVVASHQSPVTSLQSPADSLQSPAAGQWSHVTDQRTPDIGSGLATGDRRLATVEGPPSTPALAEYLDRLGIVLEPGWRVEINLRAVEWIRDAARRLRRGFIVLIDYGHEARELYSVTHSSGTLTTFAGHRSAGPEQGVETPAWLQDPGDRDLTAHVDFTSLRAAAEAEGLATIGLLDQTYFLLGLLSRLEDPQSVLRNPQYKTLMLPGGIGSTHKVLILGKGVGMPALSGCSFKVRVT